MSNHNATEPFISLFPSERIELSSEKRVHWTGIRSHADGKNWKSNCSKQLIFKQFLIDICLRLKNSRNFILLFKRTCT